MGVVVTLLAAQTWAANGTLKSAQDAIAGGRHQLAIELLEPLIREQPDNAEARFLRGVAFAQMGETDRAIAIFSNLTEQYPELSEPYNNLAVLYAAQGSLDKARAALLKATELQPDYHTAFENLGDVYTKLAAEAYQQAYHLQGNNQRARRKHDVLAGLLGPPQAAAEDPQTQATAPVEAIPPKGDARDVGAAETCLAMGPMDADTRERVGGWLGEQHTTYQPYALESREPRAYRVYLDGGDAPRALLERLKAQGIDDMALVKGGELDGDISLGVYRQRDSVERRLDQLKRLGHDAKTVTLYDAAVQHWVVIMKKDFEPQVFKRVFSHQAPRPVSCDWRPRQGD